MKKGFTLIELLVVISIIGILVATGVVGYSRATKLSRDAKRKTDLEQIRQALETYRAELGYYPGSTALLVSSYITTLPIDPKSPTYTYVYAPAAAPAKTYSLCASLETVTSPAPPSNYCLAQP